jgi:hypothetical protein
MSQELNATRPRFAPISVASSGDNTLLAAQTGDERGESVAVRLMALSLVAAGSVTAQLESGTAGSFITGAIPLIAGVPYVIPYSECGFGQVAKGEVLNVILSGATAVAGHLVYKKC